MSFELLIGPPGSGKTHILLQRARALCKEGKRVWWIGLPNQRADLFHRATGEGALLGLEFQTLQQLCYRLLAHAMALKPLLIGTARLALVGEALAEERDALPSPGEARLFAQAIAEAKRYGLEPDDLPDGDFEVDRLRAVYRRYERLKGESWDYDDFRREALVLAEAGAARPEATALIVDGVRELGPLDLRLFLELSSVCEVSLSLPEAPAGLAPTKTLEPRPIKRRVFSAPNQIVESRWLLRSLKRDLAEGHDPLDLAVVLPIGEIGAFASLADEYGVPVMDERPVSLADTLPGRFLVELLELVDYPSASRLLPVRELAPLADEALASGIAGTAALTALARRLGLEEIWQLWLERLQVPAERTEQEGWAAALVQHVVERVAAGWDGSAHHPALVPLDEFRRLALARAMEAARVATGPGFRSWWIALLKEASISVPKRGGVALLDHRLASGRRFRRAYLARAIEGAHGVAEHEDYFFAEESRSGNRSPHSTGTLPRRYAGSERLLAAELVALADELTITFPEADQSGRLLPDRRLIGDDVPAELPFVPAGSRLELAAGERVSVPESAPSAPLRLERPSDVPSLEELRRYAECPRRSWLEGLLLEVAGVAPGATTGEDGRWREVIASLVEERGLDAQRLNLLERRHPQVSTWLSRYRDDLTRLSYGVSLPNDGGAPAAFLDAADRVATEARIYLFTPPGAASSTGDAEGLIEGRWNELWAAGYLLERYPRRIERVRIIVWPLSSEPIDAYPGGIAYPWQRIVRRREEASMALEGYRSGEVRASPGYRCRGCPVRDACREAAP